MKIYLIRHGKTAGNALRKYIGKTDEEVSAEGFCELEKLPKIKADMVFCSPKKRCLQTAKVLVCCDKMEICDGLSECDFGDFENQTACELSGNASFTAWVESGCTIPIPNGESMGIFKARSVQAFFLCVEKAKKAGAKTIVIVAHGGTAMAVMSHLFSGEFYSYSPENGGGYLLWQGENGEFENIRKM